SNQTSTLIFKMRQINLKAPFLGAGATTEDLEDEAGAVQHLGLQLALEVTLLHPRQLMIDDDQLSLLLGDDLGKFGYLARADQRRRARRGNVEYLSMDDLEVDGLCKPDRLFQTCLGRKRHVAAACLIRL